MRAYINTHKDMGVRQCRVVSSRAKEDSLKETEAWIHEELDFPIQTKRVSSGLGAGYVEIKFGFYGTTNQLQGALEKVLRVLLGYGKESHSVDIKIRDVTNHYDMLLRTSKTELEGVASNKMFDDNLEFRVPLELKPLSASADNGGLVVYVEKQEGINPKVIEYEY